MTIWIALPAAAVCVSMFYYIAATVAALKCSTWGDVALISARDVEDAIAGGPDIRR